MFVSNVEIFWTDPELLCVDIFQDLANNFFISFLIYEASGP